MMAQDDVIDVIMIAQDAYNRDISNIYLLASAEHIVSLTIWHHLFLEFWLVSTWIFALWSH